MSVRPATTAGVFEIGSLIHQSATPQRGVDLDVDGWKLFCQHNRAKEIRQRLLDDQYMTLLSCREDRVVGLITLYQREKIHQLFVHPSARRYGLATELWRKARLLCERGDHSGYYWVRSSSTAVGVYEEFGFQRASERRQKKAISYYLMELTL
jgi:ribosomal protein S18 acetylase RimI-like enzyme